MTIRALAAALGCLIALHLPDSAGAAQVTNVATPSGSTHGALIGGNIPCAIGANEIGDCGKSAPAGAIVGTTDVQTLTNKTISGAQNTLAAIPDSALSANVDLLSGAQSSTGLKTFSGGLALPIGANPSGSSLYQDSNGAIHFVGPNYDAQLFGAAASGDKSRPWLIGPIGSFITESFSGQQPNVQINRNDYFSGGSGIDFGINESTAFGKGVNIRTTADAPSGSTMISVVANANIAAGQSVFGQCIPADETVSSYSSGTLNLTLATVCDVPSGGMLGIPNLSNSTPTNISVGVQAQYSAFSTANAPSGVALAGYGLKYVPSGDIVFGGNFVAHDFTGRKSSIAGGGMVGNETDVEGSGPDDNLSRFGELITFAESGPSADGATTIGYGLLVRPQAAGSQIGANPAEALIGIGASTMITAAANGVYGSFGDAFDCDGGELRGCFDVTSGTITFATSALASSDQPNLVFPYPTDVNVGQYVSGSASLPVGVKVSAVYQCALTLPLAGCGGATNETLVILSSNLTGSIVANTPLTFTGALLTGSYFNGIFNDAFANLTNSVAGGTIKAGTLLNSGTVLDIQGFGADSTNTPSVVYGDIHFDVSSNTHDSIAGNINLIPGGTGCVQISGVCLFSGGHTWSALQNFSAGASFSPGTVTLPDGSAFSSAQLTLGANVNGNGKTFNNLGGLLNNNANGYELAGGASTATNAVLLPNRADTNAGIGGSAGNVSLIADSSGSTLEVARATSIGLIIEGGSLTGRDGGTWGTGGINGSAIGGTTPSTGAFTTLAVSSLVSGAGFSSYLASPPAIGGTLAAAGTFTTITNTGHVISNGTAQSCSNVSFGTGAGTSPTCNSVTGDDHRFNINFTTGTGPGASAAIWTLAFDGGSYASAPNCLFAAVGGNTAASITKFLVSSTTTTVVMNVGSSALASSTAYNLNVQCTG